MFLKKKRSVNMAEVRQFVEYADLNKDSKIDK